MEMSPKSSNISKERTPNKLMTSIDEDECNEDGTSEKMSALP